VFDGAPKIKIKIKNKARARARARAELDLLFCGSWLAIPVGSKAAALLLLI
jgi:hypothetical protein